MTAKHSQVLCEPSRIDDPSESRASLKNAQEALKDINELNKEHKNFDLETKDIAQQRMSLKTAEEFIKKLDEREGVRNSRILSPTSTQNIKNQVSESRKSEMKIIQESKEQKKQLNQEHQIKSKRISKQRRQMQNIKQQQYQDERRHQKIEQEKRQAKSTSGSHSQTAQQEPNNKQTGNLPTAHDQKVHQKDIKFKAQMDNSGKYRALNQLNKENKWKM
ncbi:unnamed protein product [Didymodactylos carnosus]|uniref:Uncharacterized protein n=1 Tax=Didymodactylos carnosus TaxID=1234261 RepID=A0A814E265_9BILA|nr:unnamed protein product [Didymodactylos carnosus]CAF1020137.1 unnamed protein product [Didymodactylos carnosus]CAF3737164.1 unnamed protein product [Didymodactylos carnosus]CAF3788775.1 unnamed protein product [Didymodactylos carnosus]